MQNKIKSFNAHDNCEEVNEFIKNKKVKGIAAMDSSLGVAKLFVWYEE